MISNDSFSPSLVSSALLFSCLGDLASGTPLKAMPGDFLVVRVGEARRGLVRVVGEAAPLGLLKAL